MDPISTIIKIISFGPLGILVAALIIIFIKPGLLTFLTASSPEVLLMRKEFRMIKKLFNHTIIILVFPICFIILFIQSDYFKNIVEQFLYLCFYPILFFLIFYMIFIWIVLVIKTFNLKIKEKDWKEFINIPTIKYIITFSSILHILLLSTLVSLSIIEVNNYINLSNIIVFYYLFMLHVPKLMKLISSEEIIISVKLSNGEIIKECFLLYPSYGKKIWLGNSSNPSDCTQIISVSVDKIDLIEFEITYLAWGKKSFKNLSKIKYGNKEEIKKSEIIIPGKNQ